MRTDLHDLMRLDAIPIAEIDALWTSLEASIGGPMLRATVEAEIEDPFGRHRGSPLLSTQIGVQPRRGPLAKRGRDRISHES
jgi:hypothetical protein